MDGPLMLEDYVLPTPDEWIDFNDHLTEAYYGVAFADAGDAVMIQAGFGEDYRRATGGTFFTAETHIWFVAEVPKASEIRIVTTILGADAKRVHWLHEMLVAGERRALQEATLLHVDAATGRVSPMAPELEAAFTRLAEEHADRPRPQQIGRGVRGMARGPA